MRLALLCVVLAMGGCGKVAVDHENDSKLLSLKAKCREDGERVRADWTRTYHEDTFSSEPEYGYSPSLQTCLWVGEYSGPAIDWSQPGGSTVPHIVPVRAHVKFILDIYSNKTLIEYTEHDGKQIGEVSEKDFVRRKAEVLGNR